MTPLEILADWRNSIINAITKPIADTQNWFAGKLMEGLISTMEKVEVEEVEYVRDMMKQAAANPELPPEFKKFLLMFEGKKAPAWFALAPIAAAILLYPTVSAVFSGKLQEVQQVSNQIFTPAILSPAEAIAAHRRGIIKPDVKDKELAWNGYDKDHIDAIEALSEFYPAPQDFIRFAVRDTFNEAVVKRYNLDSDYPEAIDSQVVKIGMSPQWMRHFWRAHWELPSPTQMYEMLHRKKITVDDARTLLRTADVAPFFIEPMLAISYNPVTRVDIRRLWGTGKFDRQWLLDRHTDLGYDAQTAEWMAEWITSEGMKEEADLTKAEIKAALVAGEIQESDAIEAFKKLGYDDKESEIIVNLAQYSQEKALRNREKNVLVKQYAKNMITLQALESGLDALQMSEREKKITVAEAKLQVKEMKV